MNDERRSRAIRVIKALMEKRLDRGATLAEESAAISKVQELLERYQLTMFDVEKQELKNEMFRFDIDTEKRRRNPGEQSLASAIAFGYDCKLIVSSQERNVKYVFLGYKTDVEIAQYIYVYLNRILLKMADESARKAGVYKQKFIRYRNNFLMAAAGVIRQRMAQDKQGRQPVTPKATQSPIDNASKTVGTSLVMIKQPKVEAFVKTQFSSLRNLPQSKVKVNMNAIDEGRKAGHSIELRKGIEQEQTNLVRGF